MKIITAVTFVLSFGLCADSLFTNFENIRIMEIRNQYEIGFEKISLLVKKTSRMNYVDLKSIIRFRNLHFKWAEIIGDKVVSINKGSNDTAFGIVLPFSLTNKNAPASVLSVNMETPNSWLEIQPVPIDPIWAGVYLFHEMSHLQNKLFKIENYSSRETWLNKEEEAYGIEISVVNLLTSDAYSRLIRSNVVLIGKKSTQQFLDYISSNSGMSQIFRQLDATMGSLPFYSKKEIGMRTGLFVISLFFDFAYQNRIGYDENLRALNKILLNSKWNDSPYVW